MNRLHEKVLQLAKDNEHILNFYSVGPVQRAALEDFVLAIVDNCIDGVKSWRDAKDETMNDGYWDGYTAGCNDGIIEIKQRFDKDLI